MKKVVEIELVKITCAVPECGITFWLEEGYEYRRRTDKNSFHCPNGHSQSYGGDTEVQRLTGIINSKNEVIHQLKTDLEHVKRKKRRS